MINFRVVVSALVVGTTVQTFWIMQETFSIYSPPQDHYMASGSAIPSADDTPRGPFASLTDAGKEWIDGNNVEVQPTPQKKKDHEEVQAMEFETLKAEAETGKANVAKLESEKLKLEATKEKLEADKAKALTDQASSAEKAAKENAALKEKLVAQEKAVKEAKEAKKKADQAIAFDSLKAYEYPAPAGMEPDTLMACFMKKKSGIDPQVDSHKLVIRGYGYLPQDMGEWFLHKQMKNSTRVTTNPLEADTFIINTMPVLSYRVGDCAGMSHEERQNKWVEQLNASQYFRSRPRDHAYICQAWYCFKAIVPEMKELIALSSSLLIHEAILHWIFGKRILLRGKGKPPYQPPSAIIVPYVAHSFIGAHSATTHQQKQHKVTFLGSYERRSEWRAPIADPQVQKLLHTQQVEETTLMKTKKGVSDENFQKGYAHTMANSDFCLVPAGDTASSRRLFDAMMAGCIPVFIGPKFGRPFENLIPYEEFSVHFNSAQWLQKGGAYQCIRSLYEDFSQERISQMRLSMSQHSRWADWRHGDGVLEGILSNMELQKHSMVAPVKWQHEKDSVQQLPKTTTSKSARNTDRKSF